MALNEMKLSRKAKKLLELVPVDGDFIGNTTLQRRSRLGRNYWSVQKELVHKGLVTRGKGRGGSVARVLDEKSASVAIPKKSKFLVKREAELYEPVRKWLNDTWGQGVEGGDFFEVRITGTAKKRKRSSGQWSRPDVTLVQVSSYDYLPQPVLDVTTFEVKRFSDAENIRSVYETAAHSRWSHFAFLIAEVPGTGYEFPERFMSELERFNVGLIRMWKDATGWQFEEDEYETDRLSPDPKELNALLKYFFHDEHRLREFKQAIGKG
jgi:hypothetical protein